MKNIVENATVTQKNGLKQVYDAIQIAQKGIYIGRLKKIEEREEFEWSGFIPRGQIQKITVCNQQGKLEDIDI